MYNPTNRPPVGGTDWAAGHILRLLKEQAAARAAGERASEAGGEAPGPLDWLVDPAAAAHPAVPHPAALARMRLAQGAPSAAWGIDRTGTGPANMTPSEMVDTTVLLASLLPVAGDAIGLANDIRHYATEPESRTLGNYALSVLGLLPLVPSVSSMARFVKPALGQGLPSLAHDARQVFGGAPAPEPLDASRRAGYNPTPLPPRPFHDDYPGFVGGDDSGRLQTSIEGRKLDAPFVAGRRYPGQGDSGLTEEAIGEAASRLVDQVVSVPGRDLGRDLGRFSRSYDADGAARYGIAIRQDLPEVEAPRVLAHELGHAIDQMAGAIPRTGLTRELEQVYSDLATGMQGRARNRTLPRHLGYSAKESPRELMAEAIRAYMVDPNYLKTVAPKAARRIREHVNAHPRLSKVIQFNSFGLGGLGAGLAASEDEQPEPVGGER
jgi:hypothetical protein